MQKDEKSTVVANWSVYDCDPASGGDAWPSHDELEVVGASKEEIRATVLDELATAAYVCDRSDGYDVGDRIYAMITYDDETGDTVSVELTTDHLGEAEEDEERPDPDKRRATDWESAASYVSTFPDGDGEGACDVQVQVGFDEDSGAWRVLVEAALRVVGQFIRTKDDAGGSDEAPDTSYDSEDDACQAAKDFAEEHDEGDGTEDAEGYLRRQLEESADEGLDPEGGWRIWWDTTGSGSGPRGPRYATCAAAEAAAKLANEELSDTPGGNLLCGFAVAFLDEDGDWRRFDPERDAYTRG